MNVAELLKSRQTYIVNAIQIALKMSDGEKAAEIEKVADDAAQKWEEKHLPRIFGKRISEEILAKKIYSDVEQQSQEM